MSKLGEFGGRMHRGEIGYDFVGRRRLWFVVSLVLILISIGSLGIRQLNFGVEFSGGSVFQFQGPNVTQSQIEDAVEPIVSSATETDELVVQSVGKAWRVQTPSLGAGDVTKVQDALGKVAGVSPDEVSQEQIGPTWGQQVSAKAGIGLLIFLGACILFLWVVFEWKMALSAMLALIHDLVITAGIYSLVGFEVTPATVIGFLTILGYSLYDTVVVFDKVRDNTAGILGGNRTTYSRAANLAVNQTLARSINTSVVALLPVAAILFVGSAVLGAGTLEDLALALFVGIATGAYSSVFIATPFLAMLKEREPRMTALRRRVMAREAAGGADKTPDATAGQAERRSSRRKATAAAGSATRSAMDDRVDDPGDDLDDDVHDTAPDGEDGRPGRDGAGRPGKVTLTAGGSGAPQPRPADREVSSRGGQRPQPKRSGSGRGGNSSKRSGGSKKRKKR